MEFVRLKQLQTCTSVRLPHETYEATRYLTVEQGSAHPVVATLQSLLREASLGHVYLPGAGLILVQAPESKVRHVLGALVESA